MVIAHLLMGMMVRMMMMRSHRMRVPVEMPVMLRVWVGRRSVFRALRHAAPHTEKNESAQHHKRADLQHNVTRPTFPLNTVEPHVPGLLP